MPTASLCTAATFRRRFMQFLAAQIVIATLIAVIGLWTSPLQDDMAEAWAWGKEFQLGYAKHPPFFAWVAGAWFLLFPRFDWCFYLLSSINAAVGFVGIWCLAGLFLEDRARLGAVLLAALVPFQTIVAINFNATSALLSTWPWVAYCFVRSMEGGGLRYAILLGVVAALALLTKYVSVLLLLSCLIASFLHPQAKCYYRSAAPYVAGLLFTALIAPHVYWLIQHNWPTIDYAMLKTWRSRTFTSIQAVNVTAVAIAAHGLMLWGFLLAFGKSGPTLLRRAVVSIKEAQCAWLWVLVLGPFLLMLACVPILNVKLSPKFLTPMFFLVPTALLALSSAEVREDHLRLITRLWLVASLGCAIAALLLSYTMFRWQIGLAQFPHREMAQLVTDEWHSVFNRPLRIVAASQDDGHALAFYSADAPSHFIEMNFAVAPWITPTWIEREGLLIVCRDADADCTDRAAKFADPHSLRRQVSVSRSHWGWKAPNRQFTLIFIAPRGVLGSWNSDARR